MIKGRVSIIIPNYNHASFLEQRLNSVFNQTYQNFEVILLDDASTDNSLTILEKYKNHPKVSHFVVNEFNTGSPFKQWFKGIELAKGEFIWIAESDDYSDLDFLFKTVELADSLADFGFIFTDLYPIENQIETKSLIETNTALNKFHESEDGVFDTVDKISSYLIKNLIIYNASSVLFNKNALRKIDLEILNDFKNTGDRFVYISIALKFKCYYLNQPLNYFRIHQTNTTNLNIENGSIFLDRLRIIRYFIQDINVSKYSRINLFTFFKGQYFNSINFKFYSELTITLKELYKFKYISLMKFINFYLYILLNKYSNNSLPGKFHNFMIRFLR
jgi:glycosyltransferase involved in cell wall biosynthesis